MRWTSLGLAGLFLLGCTPTLNWRDVRPADSGAVALFPCKPDSHARQVRLAGAQVRLVLHACSAGGATWALGVADMVDPARVGPALDELKAAAADNLSASAPQTLPLNVAGATPHPSSTRLALSGKLPDGQAVQEQVAVFAKGTRVYQATSIGPALQADALETFFAGLRTPE